MRVLTCCIVVAAGRRLQHCVPQHSSAVATLHKCCRFAEEELVFDFKLFKPYCGWAQGSAPDLFWVLKPKILLMKSRKAAVVSCSHIHVGKFAMVTDITDVMVARTHHNFALALSIK